MIQTRSAEHHGTPFTSFDDIDILNALNFYKISLGITSISVDKSEKMRYNIY